MQLREIYDEDGHLTGFRGSRLTWFQTILLSIIRRFDVVCAPVGPPGTGALPTRHQTLAPAVPVKPRVSWVRRIPAGVNSPPSP